jgi:hypothetical protein
MKIVLSKKDVENIVLNYIKQTVHNVKFNSIEINEFNRHLIDGNFAIIKYEEKEE